MILDKSFKFWRLAVTYQSPQGRTTGLKVLITWKDWNKFIPFCSAGTFLRPLRWPESTSGTQHKFVVLRHPIPSWPRWAGQIVISSRFGGFWKCPHLDKMSSTFVSTPEDLNDFLWCRISLLHCVSAMTEVEVLVRSSAPQIPPTILKNEHDIVIRVDS